MKAKHKKLINDWWNEVRELAIATGASSDDVDRQIADDRKCTDKKVGLVLLHEDPSYWIENMLERIKNKG